MKRRFYGVWNLVAYEQYVGGQLAMSYGEKPVALLIYAPPDTVAVQIMANSRMSSSVLYGAANELNKPLQITEPMLRYAQGTAEEAVNAYRSYVAYYGTFAVHEGTDEVVHTVIGSLLPNLVLPGVSKELPRKFAFSNDDKTLVLQEHTDILGDGRLFCDGKWTWSLGQRIS